MSGWSWFRRREAPWEVIECKHVSPVLMYDDEDSDLEILRLSDTETCGTYVFDFHKEDGRRRSALIFARQQLLEEMQKRDLNVLLEEGWRLTVLRKGKRSRIEIQYNGRGALALGKVSPRQPPFVDLLGKD